MWSCVIPVRVPAEITPESAVEIENAIKKGYFDYVSDGFRVGKKIGGLAPDCGENEIYSCLPGDEYVGPESYGFTFHSYGMPVSRKHSVFGVCRVERYRYGYWVDFPLLGPGRWFRAMPFYSLVRLLRAAMLRRFICGGWVERLNLLSMPDGLVFRPLGSGESPGVSFRVKATGGRGRSLWRISEGLARDIIVALFSGQGSLLVELLETTGRISENFGSLDSDSFIDLGEVRIRSISLGSSAVTSAVVRNGKNEYRVLEKDGREQVICGGSALSADSVSLVKKVDRLLRKMDGRVEGGLKW